MKKLNKTEQRKLDYSKTYNKEMKWLESNIYAKENSFLMDMLEILKSGSRNFSEKMLKAVHKSMQNPAYDITKRIELESKAGSIKQRLEMIEELVYKVDEFKGEFYVDNYSPIKFVRSLKSQLKRNLTLSSKQLGALNKVYKRYIKMLDKIEND